MATERQPAPDSGYTIIELLIVMSIMAVVAMLVIPRLSNHGQDTGAFALALGTYLNSASSYANGHETGVCISQSSGSILASPMPQTLTIPAGLSVSSPSYCYDTKGQVSAAQTFTVNASSSTSHQVIVKPGYGTAQVN